MADAHDDAVGQLLADQAVEGGFGFFIERGGGLIEQHEAGAGDEDAHEGDALQLAGGKFVLPVVFGVEQFFQVAQAAGFEGGGKLVFVGADVGVADGAAQAALRGVGALGHEEDVFTGGADDVAAAAEGPEAGQGAQQ